MGGKEALRRGEAGAEQGQESGAARPRSVRGWRSGGAHFPRWGCPGRTEPLLQTRPLPLRSGLALKEPLRSAHTSWRAWGNSAGRGGRAPARGTRGPAGARSRPLSHSCPPRPGTCPGEIDACICPREGLPGTAQPHPTQAQLPSQLDLQVWEVRQSAHQRSDPSRHRARPEPLRLPARVRTGACAARGRTVRASV